MHLLHLLNLSHPFKPLAASVDSPNAAMDTLTAPTGAASSPIFKDGFGTRWLALDPESGDAVEILAVAPELVEQADFASAVGERVARLARVRHTLYARARRLDRPDANQLHIYADRIPGWRLADVLRVVEREQLTLDISAVLALLRQLVPAVALFSRHQRDAAIGSIGPERLILTPSSRLVVAEYALAPGIEKLHGTRERLWRQLRVALPHSASPTRIPPTADVAGMGIVALSLLLGRLLKEDEYLVALGDLVESAVEWSGGTSRPLSPGLKSWIARALQFDDHQGFQSTQEAQLTFEEMLAKERSYVTTSAQLDLLVARFEKLAGPPAEPPLPKSAPAAVVAVIEGATVSVAEPAPGITVEPAREGGDQTVATPRLEPPPAPAPRDETTPVAAAVHTPLPAPTTPSRARLSRVAALLAAVVVFETGLIVWLVSGANPEALGRHGGLVIQSRPVAARVSIDGEERGVTPLTTELSPGAHIVEVRVGRSEPRVIPVMIREGVQNDIYVELQSVATVGALDVRTEPAGARVTVDGRSRGATPLVVRDLPPGEHEVLIEAGRQKVRQTVKVEPGITSQLVVPLR